MLNKKRFSLMLGICLIFLNLHATALHRVNDLTLLSDFSIGVEEGDENFMFGSILDVALDSEENIYVLDSRNLQVRKFDPQGSFLFSLSLEKGQGPREVSQTSAIAVTPSGEIAVFDQGAKKLLLFDSQGQFRKPLQFDFQATDIAVYGPNQIAVLGIKDGAPLHIYDREGNYLESFGQLFEVPAKMSQYKDMAFMRAPMRFDSSSGNKVFLVNPHKYEISVIENGKFVGIVKGQNKTFLPIAITKSNLGSMGVVFPVLHILESQNTMYVCIRGRGIEAKHQLDVFLDSQLIGSLEVIGIPRAIDAQGRLYFIEEEDYPQVVRYKLAN